VTVDLRTPVQVAFTPEPSELGMRRVHRLVITVIPVIALAACASPTAPVSSENSCPAGKVPYASCANRDYVNPIGDYVNPLGDYVNPIGRDTIRTSE
jgi:hypothetical protein